MLRTSSPVFSGLSFFFHYHCCYVLLALLLAFAAWVNKYFASSSGRKGWSACVRLKQAELSHLLTLCLVPSWAAFSSLFCAMFGDGNQCAQKPFGASTVGFNLVLIILIQLEVVLQWPHRVVVCLLLHTARYSGITVLIGQCVLCFPLINARLWA